METKENKTIQDKITSYIPKIVGYILILISIFFFIGVLVLLDMSKYTYYEDSLFYVMISKSNNTPIFFGLLSIAGAYLIKNDKK